MNYDKQFEPESSSPIDFSKILAKSSGSRDIKESERKKQGQLVKEGIADVTSYDYDHTIQKYMGEEFKPNFGNVLEKYERMKREENDRLAEQQTWGGNLLRGTGNALTTFLTGVASLPGYVYAMGEAALTDKTIGETTDNAWINFFDGVKETAGEELFKTYIPSDIQNGSVWDKMTSGSWWATTGADAIGMLAEFIVPGQFLKMAKLGSGAMKITRATKLIDPKKVKNFLKNADDITAATFNSSFESAMEAREAFQNYYGQLQSKVKSGELTDEEARKLAGEQASKVFMTNMVLLSASNMIDQKWLGGFKSESRAERVLMNSLKSEGVEQTAKKWYTRIPTAGYTVAKAFLKEGAGEEGMQYATQKYYGEQLKDPSSVSDNPITGIFGAYIDSLDETEFQEAVALGTILASPMAGYGDYQQNKYEKELLYGRPDYKPSSVAKFFGKETQKGSKGLINMMKDNFIKTYGETDIWKRKENGEFELDKNGKQIVDNEKRAKIIESYFKDDGIRMAKFKAKLLNDEVSYNMLNDMALFNFFKTYYDIEGGSKVFEAHLNDIVESEVKQRKAVFNEDISANTIRQEIQSKYNELETQYAKYTNNLTHTNKLSKADKKAHPYFDQLLTAYQMDDYIKQKHYKTQIDKLESEIAELENSPIPANQKLAEPLKNEKKRYEKFLDEVVTKGERIYTKEGQESILKEYNDAVKESAKNIKDIEEDAITEEDSTKVKNPEHQKLYKDLSKTEMIDGKKVVGHGSMRIYWKTGRKNEQAYMDFEIEGISENGELLLKNPKGEIITLTADNKINGKDVNKIVPLTSGKDGIAKAKQKAGIEPDTKGNTSSPVTTSDNFEDRYTKVADKTLDTLTERKNPRPPFVENSTSVFLRTINQHEEMIKLASENPEAYKPFLDFYKFVLQTESFDDFWLTTYTYNTLPDDVKAELKGASLKESAVFLVVTDSKGAIYKPMGTALISYLAEPTEAQIENLIDRRFSWTKFDAKYKNLSEQALRQKKRKALEASIKKFYAEVRNPILENDKAVQQGTASPIKLRINGVRSGAKQKVEAAKRLDETVVTEFTVNDLQLEISTDKADLGFVYVKHAHSRIPVIRQTLNDEISNRVLNIMEYYTTADKGEFKLLHNILNTMVYMVYQSSDKKVSDYTFYPIEKNNKIIGWKIGADTVTAEEFSTEEGKNKVKAFLAKKIINVDKPTLNAGGDFSLYDVVNGELVATKTYNEKEGGYKKFLVDKGLLVHLESNKSENPQFLNSSLSFDSPYFKPKEKKVKVSKKNAAPVSNIEAKKADIERRRQEELKPYNERDVKSLEAIMPNNPNHPTFKVGMKFNQGMNIIVKETLAADNYDGREDAYEAITVIISPAEFGADGKMTKAAEVKVTLFNTKEDADKAIQEKYEKVKSKVGQKQKEINAKYDVELAALESPSQKESLIKNIESELADESLQKEGATTVIDESGFPLDQIQEIMKRTGLTKEEVVATLKSVQDIEDDPDDLNKLFQGEQGEITPEALAWFNNKFPNWSPVFITNGLINGISLGRVTKNMEVLFSKFADDRTVYHEAFHVVSQFFLTEKERTRMYNEVRKRLGDKVVKVQSGKRIIEKKGNELTDKEAEEFLAEEFEDFKLTGEYKFNEGNEVTQTFFDRIWNWIKSLFGVKSIEDIFKKIESGEFDKLEAKISASFNESYDKIGNLNAFDQQVLLDHFNVMFFDTLVKESLNKESKKESIYNVTQSDINNTYNTIKTVLVTKDVTGKITLEQKSTLKHFDDLVAAHKEFLKIYSIDVKESIDEEAKKGSDNTQFVESLNKDLSEEILPEIKILIASLPQKEFDENGISKFTRYTPFHGVHYYKNVNYQDTIRTLYSELANIPTPELMWEKLQDLSKRFPSFETLVKRLGLADGYKAVSDLNRKNGKALFNLRTNFYVTFSNNKLSVKQALLTRDSNLRFIDPVTNSIEKNVTSIWKANLALQKVENPYFRFSNGEYYIDANRAFTLPSNNPLSNNPEEFDIQLKDIQNINKDKLFKIFDSIEAAEDYLAIFGIEVNKNIPLKVVQDFIYWSAKEFDLNKNLSINSFFNRDETKLAKEVKALARAQAKFMSGINNQWTKANGQSQNAITLPSKFSRTIDELNNGITDEFTPFSPNNLDGNLQTIYSQWAKNYDNLKLVLLDSIKPDRKDVVDLAESKPGDYFMMEFNAILHGISPLVAAAGRKLEYGVQFTPELTQRDILAKTTTEMVEIFKGYLHNEIVVALAHKNNPNFKRLVKAGKLGEQLRFFKDIVPNINDIIAESEELDPANYIEKARTIIQENDKYIKDALVEYLNKREEDTMNMLLDKEYTHPVTKRKVKGFRLFVQAGKNYKNYGLSEDLKTKLFGEDVEDLSYNDISKLARAFSFYYITNAMEHIKHSMGDLATYNKIKNGALVSETFKRFTTVVSTKTAAANDANIITDLNTFSPRADGHLHDDKRKELVIADVIVQAELHDWIKETYGIAAYNKIKKNDAQGLAFLDGMRSFAKRTGIWIEGQEITFQYEMQKFFYEHVLKNPKRVEQLKTSLDKINNYFKDHLPNGWTGVPMYLGEPIDIKNMEPIAPMKPQGVGRILNNSVKSSGAVDITKLSIAPLMPSEMIGTPMEDLLYEGMENGLDFIIPESAKKGDIVGNKVGALPSIYNNDGTVSSINDILKDGFEITEISWSDIGNQLDIDPSGKRRIKESTQKATLESVDIFERGLASGEFKDLEQDVINQIKLKNAKSAVLKREALLELGLEEIEGGYKLVDEDRFLKVLKKEFTRNTYSMNAMNGIKAALKEDIKIFDTLNVRKNIEYVITSVMDSRMGTHRVNGDMMVLRSSALTESTKLENADYLKFYRPVKADGSEYTKEELKKLKKEDIERIAPAEMVMTLPPQFISFVEEHYAGISFDEKLQKFNKDITDPKKKEYWDNLLTFTANRTPNQHINNIEVVRVVKFLAPWNGNTIILPAEVTIKSGSDFDIDKLNAYFTNLRINKKTGKITKVAPKESVESRYQDYVFSSFKKAVDDAREQRKEFQEDLDNLLDEYYEEFKNKQKGFNINFKEEWKNLRKKVIASAYKVETDQLAEAINLLTLEEFKALPIEEQYPIEVLDNLLQDVTKKLVLHPNNFESFLAPNGADELEAKIKKILSLPENYDALDFNSQLEFRTNFEYRLDQFAADAVLGAAANAATFHSKIQKVGLKMNPDLVFTIFNSSNHLGLINDVDGNKISLAHSQKISGSVDAEKQNKPALILANITPNTMGVASLLAEMGVSEDVILEFLTHDVVKDFIMNRNVFESKLLENKRRTATKEGQAAMTLRLENPETLNNWLHNKFKAVVSGDSTALDAFEAKKKEFQNIDFNTASDKHILEFYLYIEEVAKYYNELAQRLTKQDTAKPKSLAHIREIEFNINKLYSSNIFNNDDLNRLFSNTHLAGFRANQQVGYDAFGQFYLDYNPEFDAFQRFIDELMVPHANNPVDKKLSIRNNFINRTLTYIVNTQKGVDGSTINNKVKELMTGDNSIIQRIFKLRGENREFAENPFIKNLALVSEKYDYNTDSKLPYDSLEKMFSKLNALEINGMIRGYMELIENPNEEIRNIATDLLTLSIIQGAWINSRTNINDLFPVEAYHAVTNKLIMDSIKDNFNILDNKAIDTIMANSWYDSSIVPQIYSTIWKPRLIRKEGKVYMKLPTSESKNSLSNRLYLTVLDQVKHPNPKRKAPLDRYYFMKLISTEKGVSLYEAMPMLGSRGSLFEVGTSIIPSNNYDFDNKKKGDTTKTKEVDKNRKEELDAISDEDNFGYTSEVEEDDFFSNIPDTFSEEIIPKKEERPKESDTSDIEIYEELQRQREEEKLEKEQEVSVKEEGFGKESNNIEILTSNYTRQSVQNDVDSLYLFTDNAQRTSRPSANEENVDKNSWYYKKYKSQTNKPIHFGSTSNPTSAVIRGLNNAYPISTMSAYGTNWTDSNFELFKQTIDDEIAQIKKDLSKFSKVKIGDFRIGQGGRFAKLPQQHQQYLDNKLLEIGIDNTGNKPKIINSPITPQQKQQVQPTKKKGLVFVKPTEKEMQQGTKNALTITSKQLTAINKNLKAAGLPTLTMAKFNAYDEKTKKDTIECYG